jgi:hypothetical protein
MIRPESSAHYYTRAGQPRHEWPRADGKGMKPTTKREARIYNLVPSVTNIQSIVRKPYLESWKANQYLTTALEFAERGAFSADTIDNVIDSTEDRMAIARDTGSEYHADLAEIVKALTDHDPLEDGGFIIPDATVTEFVRWFRKFELHTRMIEYPFACAGGYGGCIDWVGLSRLGDGPGAYFTVADWKSQATLQNKDFRTYPEWACQLAAYAYGIGRPDALLVNLCVSTTEPGRIEHFIWPTDDNEMYFQAFQDAFAVWRGPLGRNFDPR